MLAIRTSQNVRAVLLSESGIGQLQGYIHEQQAAAQAVVHSGIFYTFSLIRGHRI